MGKRRAGTGTRMPVMTGSALKERGNDESWWRERGTTNGRERERMCL